MQALEGSIIPVAAVLTGFPADQSLYRLRIAEIVRAGARESNIVILHRHVLTGNWPALSDKLRQTRAECAGAHVKAILTTGKRATLPVTMIMIRSLRDLHDRTSIKLGYKPAAGILKAKDVRLHMALIKR